MGLLSVLLSSAMAAEAAALESLSFIAIIGGVFLGGIFLISILGSFSFEYSSKENEEAINDDTFPQDIEVAA